MATQLYDSDLQSNRSLDMLTNTSITIPSLALCGMLTAAIPAGAATRSERVMELPASVLVAVATDATMSNSSVVVQDDDLTPRSITSSELVQWARSMTGGDTSRMLDI